MGWGLGRDRWSISLPVGDGKQLKVPRGELQDTTPLNRLGRSQGIAACFADDQVQRNQCTAFSLGDVTDSKQRHELPVDGVVANIRTRDEIAWHEVRLASHPSYGAGFEKEVISICQVVFERRRVEDEAVLTKVKLVVKATSPLPPEETTHPEADPAPHQLHRELQKNLQNVLDKKTNVAFGHGASVGGDAVGVGVAAVDGQGAAVDGQGAAVGGLGPKTKAGWCLLKMGDVDMSLVKDGSTLKSHGIQNA
ncbi:unnamed protein product [Chrysoparadoxa australica]